MDSYLTVSLLGIPATRGFSGHDHGGLDILKFYFILFTLPYLIFYYIILFFIILFYFFGLRFQVSDTDSFLEPFSYSLIFSIHYTISLKMEMIYSNYQTTIIFIYLFVCLFIYFLTIIFKAASFQTIKASLF